MMVGGRSVSGGGVAAGSARSSAASLASVLAAAVNASTSGLACCSSLPMLRSSTDTVRAYSSASAPRVSPATARRAALPALALRARLATS